MSSTAQYLRMIPSDRDPDIPTLVDCILSDAVVMGASDIHLEPWEETFVVRLRLNGVLNELAHLPKHLQDRLSARCKVLGDIESYQSGLPQDGHVAADPARGNVDFRVSVMPAVRGEKIVLRVFDPNARRLNLDDLGLEPESQAQLVRLLARPNGLILLTGPTGSGKTTVMYSSLLHIAQRAGPAVSISTIEDPVEVWLPMVTQSQVNPARDFTYPVALRAIMRQDPQVILVGEIRDAETAATALQAGMTGHLVISTMHSTSGVGVFARLIHMEMEPFLLASSVAGVMAVRLVRSNCRACQVPSLPESRLLDLLPPDFVPLADFQRGTGCSECHGTGFSGRLMLAEILRVDETFRDVVMRRQPSRALQETAMQNGMQTLWQNGLQRVQRGETTLEELIRVVPPDNF